MANRSAPRILMLAEPSVFRRLSSAFDPPVDRYFGANMQALITTQQRHKHGEPNTVGTRYRTPVNQCKQQKGFQTRGYFECNPDINKRQNMRGIAVLRALLSFWHHAPASVVNHGSYVRLRPSTVDRAACESVVIVGSPSGYSRNTAVQYGLGNWYSTSTSTSSWTCLRSIIWIISSSHDTSHQGALCAGGCSRAPYHTSTQVEDSADVMGSSRCC